jgi:hypothetical protein
MITKDDTESVVVSESDLKIELAAYLTSDFNRDEWESVWRNANDEYAKYFEESVNRGFLMNPDLQSHLDTMFLFIPPSNLS